MDTQRQDSTGNQMWRRRMSTTTTRRLAVVPSVESISDQLLAYAFRQRKPNLTCMDEREPLARHLYGNLAPNADAPTVEELSDAIRALTDTQVHYDREHELVTVSSQAVVRLLRLRTRLEALR